MKIYYRKKPLNRVYLNNGFLFVKYYYAKNFARSSSTLEFGAMPNFSTNILTTLSLKKAGSVGPRCMFFYAK